MTEQDFLSDFNRYAYNEILRENGETGLSFFGKDCVISLSFQYKEWVICFKHEVYTFEEKKYNDFILKCFEIMSKNKIELN